MTTLRPRSALRLLAVIALCAPLAACDDKKAMRGKPSNATAGGLDNARMAVAEAEARRANANQPLAEKPQTENYQHFVENAYVLAAREPRSTFSASVDTAAYSILRSKISGGQLPPREAVRVADLLNYFDYDYPKPQGNAPVAATLELAPCPWQPKHHLLRIALAARKYAPGEMPARNLVFLVDTSGSMDEPN